MSSDEIRRVIEKAKGLGVSLSPEDFEYTLDGLAIDGMDPKEWLEAMTME